MFDIFRKSLLAKMLLIGFVLALIPFAVIAALSWFQNQRTLQITEEESLKLAYSDLDHMAQIVYSMCESHQKSIDDSLSAALKVARKIAKDMGGITILGSGGGSQGHYAAVKWDAVNQFNKQVAKVELPRMAVRERWLGKVKDPNILVPIVDEVRDMLNVTCTIFQRMNQAGDMLRIATNVMGSDGTRAIGTYIPAIEPNGRQNKVISSIMRGETFKGRAFVVNAWYITTYEPIYDENNSIIGVLYVGIPQDNPVIREAVQSIKVGTSGYIWVIDSKANYVIAKKDSGRENESIWDVRDHKNSEIMIGKELAEIGSNLGPGQIGEFKYYWKNPGDPEPLPKVAKMIYFEPWDWIIGPSSYDHEFLASTKHLNQVVTRNYVLSFIATLMTLALSMGIWYWMAGRITKPVLRIGKIINKVSEGDLTLQARVESRDEIGQMATEFNHMVGILRESFETVDGAARRVGSHAEDVFQRAAANRERAEVSEKRAQEAEQIIRDMGVTAGEVSQASNEQGNAAKLTADYINGLLNDMKTVADASRIQAAEANSAAERVDAMGETGKLVVATAGKQGDAVRMVTEAMDTMQETVREMTKAAERSTDHGRQVLDAAKEGAESVNATVEGMRAIAESSDQISEIIDVITEIAEQTNLLALNAAIEAARAGAHGKGFAVVADEVGKLAQRSSEAAKEITQLIKDSTTRVSEGTALTDQSQVALRKIAEGGEINMQAIAQIVRTTDELAQATTDATKMMGELNTLAMEIETNAGKQGERRMAARNALSVVVEQSESVSKLVENADQTAQKISDEMEGVLGRTQLMEKLTGIQSGRSQKSAEISSEQAQGARQTVEGAGQVVGITEELQKVSTSLIQMVGQFRYKTFSVKKRLGVGAFDDDDDMDEMAA